MLNDEDIIKLKSILSTKEDIKDLRTELKQEISNSQDNILSLLATKQELQEVKNDMADLKELVQGLIISTDGIAKAIGNLSIEYAAISTQLSRHELWIKQIAEKVGLKLAMD
jgi:predicted  nucleic acid-binding Zn-ribbon protein